MNELLGFLKLASLLILATNRTNDEHNCPSCKILSLRNADNNVDDPCHDVYKYVCLNSTTVPLTLKKHRKSSKVPSLAVSKSGGEEHEDFSEYDVDVKIHQEEFAQKARENLFGKKKKYMSRVLKVSPDQGRSFLPLLVGVNTTHADINLINHTLSHVFQRQRNQLDIQVKEDIRKAVLQLFQSFGLKTEVHKFVQYGWINNSYAEFYAKNLIAVLPSERFGKKGDRIFVIGGHYDTVYRNPGIDDNGSGSTAVLEAARILAKHKGELTATIYFVLFDQEESGLDGSSAFVSEYLIPKILEKQNATFVGAYVTDMVLLYDPKPKVQTLPNDFIEMCPTASARVSNNSDRGDFISIWAREADKLLWSTLEESWNELSEEDKDGEYKLIVFKSPIAEAYNDFGYEARYSTFMRSDHASFWVSQKYNKNYKTLPAVLLCDLGPWRGYQRKCYHKPCDNMVQLTDTNLHFMAKNINAVVRSTLKILRKPN